MNELINEKFTDYLEKNKIYNLHEELREVFSGFPEDLNNMNHFIMYGPSGVGKYTQALLAISKYSKSALKYERKAIICLNKNQYYYKLSDIHIEIDMEMLGPSSKTLWIEIINQLYDIINSLNKKVFIVLCKNFDKTRDELMDIFYGYLNNSHGKPIVLKYIFLTNNPSLIPESILNICLMLPVKRPSMTSYKKIAKIYQELEQEKAICKNKHIDTKQITKGSIKEISNIKEFLLLGKPFNKHKKITNTIFEFVYNYEIIDIKQLRNHIYDLFTYNLCVKTFVKDLVMMILKVFELSNEKIKKIFLETNNFYRLYNNNYRPIYHIEDLIISFVKIIHDL